MKTCAHEKCAELFSPLSCPDNRRQRLFFKLIEVETKFPFANSISEFSRSQDPKAASAEFLTAGTIPLMIGFD